MKIRPTPLLLLMALSMFTCDENEPHISYPDLTIYIKRFEKEAQRRGYDLDLSAIQTAYVDNIVKPDGTFCGYGYSNYDGNGLRRIEISKSAMCNWEKLTNTERENLMFHEIGHAFFNRGHDNTRLCDGPPLTLMVNDILSTQVYLQTEAERRAYYISELIDPIIGLEKCIKPEKNWSTDPIFYKYSNTDNGLYFYSSNGKYVGQKNEAISISASTQNNATETGYWFRQFVSPNIPECAEVKLKVTMNSNNLTGEGVAIAMRVYDNEVEKQGAHTKQYLFLTTEDNPVSGTLTDFKQELVIPCFSRKTAYLVIFVVMMPGTQGEVKFSDVQLVVKEK